MITRALGTRGGKMKKTGGEEGTTAEGKGGRGGREAVQGATKREGTQV